MTSLWQELAEDEGSRFLQNVVTHIPNYTASYPKRPKFWPSELWELWILQCRSYGQVMPFNTDPTLLA